MCSVAADSHEMLAIGITFVLAPKLNVLVIMFTSNISKGSIKFFNLMDG